MDRRPLQIALLLVCTSACSTATTRNGSFPELTSSQEQARRALTNLKVDTWVRVVAGGDTVEGQVVAYERDTLMLQEAIADGNRLATTDSTSMVFVQRDDLDALWERGVSKRTAQLVGGIVGGVLGAVAGYLRVDAPPPESPVHQPGAAEYAISAGIGGFIGILLGGITAELISSGKPVWKQRYP